MKLRNYGNRESQLLRSAPYVDIAELRIKLAEDAVRLVEKYPHLFTATVRNRTIRFSNGELDLLPSNNRFKRLLQDAIWSLYPAEYQADSYRSAAYSELAFYFFSSNKFLQISK